MDATRVLVYLIFLAVSSVGVIWGLRHRFRLFQFPFLLSLSTVGYICPQIIPAITRPGFVPDDAYFITMIHGIVCMVAGYIGYFTYKTPPLTKAPAKLRPNRLMHVAAALIVQGFIFYVLLDYIIYGSFLGRHSTEGSYTTYWSKLPVALMFMARLVFPGLIIAIFTALRFRPLRISHCLLIALGVFYPVMDVILLGRRSMAFMVVGVFVLPLFYVRLWTPPRWFMLLGAVVGILIVVLFPAYRPYMQYDADHAQMLKIDPVEEFIENFTDNDSLEFPYNMFTVGAIFHTGRYGFGIDFYNTIIQAFVPKMVVGEKAKENAFLPGATPPEDVAEVYGRSHTGKWYLSEQGIIDSFWEFGFLGSILFVLLGIATRHMYDRSMRDRSMTYCLLSCLLSWLTPFIVYGGFLFGFRNLVMTLPILIVVIWYCTDRRKPAAVAGLNRSRTMQGRRRPQRRGVPRRPYPPMEKPRPARP